MEKKAKYLILIAILLVLLFPKPASADIFGILDAIGVSLGGVEEVSRSVSKQIYQFFFVYIISIVSLYTSASLLQLAVENPQWLSVMNNDMVKSGWNFTSGIANMLIILILLAIALSFIFRRDNFQIKKTLPKLLMVALLINFSLVFVGGLVDITNILFNTILSGNRGLITQIIDALGVGMWGIVNNLMIWIVALAVAFAIPFVGSFAQLALVTGVVSILFLPNILIWIFQIFSSFSMSLLFITYAFLFGARIFIVQILAIVAPLAFLCSILPQTQKYWNEWFSHLLQWLFFGISLFFFLIIGLRAATWIMPPGVSYPFNPVAAIGWLNIQGYFVYYFFLLVYLVVAGWISKRAMPTVAGAVIAQGKELGGFMWKGALKPLGGAFTRATRQAAVEQRKTEEIARAEKRPLRFREKVGSFVARPTRWVYRQRGTTPEREVAKESKKEVENLEKRFGKDIGSALEAHPFKRLDPGEKANMALYLEKVKGAEGLDKLSKKEQQEAVRLIVGSVPHKLENIIRHKPEMIDDADIKDIVQRTLVAKGMDDKDVERLIKIGAVDAAEEAEAIRKAAFKKAVEAMKTSDIENLSVKTLENKDFQEMVVRFKSSNFIKKIGEEKGSEYIEMIRERAQKLGPEEIAKTNSTLLRQSVHNPGFKAIFSPLKIDLGTKKEKEIDSDDIERFVKSAREKIKKTEKELEESRRPLEWETPISTPPPRGSPPYGSIDDKIKRKTPPGSPGYSVSPTEKEKKEPKGSKGV